MKHLQQGKNQCGQTCVAMVANTTIAHVVELAGKDGGTHATHLIKALELLNIKCTKKCERLRLRKAPESEWLLMLPKVAILRIQSRIQPNNWRGHWVLKYGCLIHDPDKEDGQHFNDYLQARMIGLNFTSMIEIYQE